MDSHKGRWTGPTNDEKVLELVAELVRHAAPSRAFMPIKAVVVAEVYDDDGNTQVFTISTKHPAWQTLGLLAAAQMQANQALAGAYHQASPPEEES